MRISFWAVLLFLSAWATPSWAGRCEGGSCNVCTNCSRCAYCSAGGYCSVCAGEGGGRSSSSPRESSVRAAPSFEPSRNFEPDTSFEETPTPDPNVAELRRAESEAERAERKRQAREQAALLEAAPFSGRCVAVVSGQSVRVQRGRRREKVDLYALASPVQGQPFGAQSRALLRNLLEGEMVKVFPQGRSATGRRLGWVFVAGKCANRTMIERGLAWHAAPSAPGEVKLAALQTNAQQKRAGLWSKQAVAPWLWQKGTRLASWTPPRVVASPEKTSSSSKAKPGAPTEAKSPAPPTSSLPLLLGTFAVGGALALALRKRKRP